MLHWHSCPYFLLYKLIIQEVVPPVIGIPGTNSNSGNTILNSPIEAKAIGFRVLAGKNEGMSRHFHFRLSSKFRFSGPCLRRKGVKVSGWQGVKVPRTHPLGDGRDGLQIGGMISEVFISARFGLLWRYSRPGAWGKSRKKFKLKSAQ